MGHFYIFKKKYMTTVKETEAVTMRESKGGICERDCREEGKRRK